MGYFGGLLARNYDDINRQQNVNANNRPSNALEMALGMFCGQLHCLLLFLIFAVLS
jgi:hypothetical protein